MSKAHSDGALRKSVVRHDVVMRGVIDVSDVLLSDPDLIGRSMRAGKTNQQMASETVRQLDRLEGREP